MEWRKESVLEMRKKRAGKQRGSMKKRWTEKIKRDEERPVSVSHYRCWQAVGHCPTSTTCSLSPWVSFSFYFSLSPISLFVWSLLIWTLTTSLFLSRPHAPHLALFFSLVIRSWKDTQGPSEVLITVQPHSALFSLLCLFCITYVFGFVWWKIFRNDSVLLLSNPDSLKHALYFKLYLYAISCPYKTCLTEANWGQ